MLKVINCFMTYMDFNKIQKELVQECERLHCVGVRHTGLSGFACENLLMEKLRKSIPDLKFDRGIIKICKEETTGRSIKKDDISPQIDIIIYQGKEIFKYEGFVIVHKENVLGVIEVKKWTSKQAFKQALDEENSSDKKKTNLQKLQIIKGLLGCKPIFYVSFRAWGNDEDWFRAIENLKDNGIKFYCFYGAVRKGKYPWEEKRWENFENKEDNRYIGQYKELIENIQKLDR